jgi:hypothetical protein
MKGGHKVDYGIGLSYRPVWLQAGEQVRQPYAIVDFGTMTFAFG